MGRRSRRREAAPVPPPQPGAQPEARPRRPRGEERDAEVRAKLRPLGPGERPRALLIAVGLAGFMAVANLIAAFLTDFGGAAANTKLFAVLQSTVLTVAAVGMWHARYWALLGFQALLALQVIVLFLALLRVERLLVGAGVLLLILALGAIFWSLIRVMARVQLPDRGR